MDTATPAQPRERQTPEPSQEPASIDPVHDIDALKTSLALVISGLVVFITMWLLYNLFSFVMFDVREDKVRESPAIQLQQVREYEDLMLRRGDAREGVPARSLSIEEAMEAITKR